MNVHFGIRADGSGGSLGTHKGHRGVLLGARPILERQSAVTVVCADGEGRETLLVVRQQATTEIGAERVTAWPCVVVHGVTPAVA